MTRKQDAQAVGMYAILDRDVVDFLEMVHECEDVEVLRTLWLMLTMENSKQDEDTKALNKMGADIIRPTLEKKGVDLSPIKQ